MERGGCVVSLGLIFHVIIVFTLRETDRKRERGGGG